MHRTQLMPSLPIPLISSLVLVFLLIRMAVSGRHHWPLIALLGICAAQGVIMSLAQHYLVPGAAVVQALTATVIPPTAWFAFQATAVRNAGWPDLLHALGPVAALLALAVFPPAIDLIIPALFLGYGLAVLFQVKKGPDALPRMRLEAGHLPSLIWLVIAAALLGSAATDAMIYLAHQMNADALRPWIISVYASAMLLVMGALALSDALRSTAEDGDPQEAPPATPQDAQIFQELEQLMQAEHPYLNPDLTLSQLSRRLRVPVKPLSAAINRITGENVSRYINNARILAAQRALQDGQSVTAAMLGAGFNTKSNFNREFLRVTQQSPTQWLDEYLQESH